jgi:predicted nucleic acid-binding protein
MIVVSNTSPVTNLALIGRLDLLSRMYGSVTIPQAVWYELAIKGAHLPSSQQVVNAPWLHVREVVNRALVLSLRQELDAGEAEAIALALEMNADLLLIDERIGRESALHFGLNYIGLIGVLQRARQRDIVPVLRPLLDVLRLQAGFWISEALYRRVLHDAGESE